MDFPHNETLLEKLGGGRLNTPALAGIVALLVMVAVFAGRIVIDAATASEQTLLVTPEASLTYSEDASSTATNRDDDAAREETDDAQSSESNSMQGEPSTVFVHVSGAVNSPGLVEVASGSRVADAIDAAGGLADEAAGESVNLARKVDDGEQIHVLAQGDEAAPLDNVVPEATKSESGLVNLNTASASELESLPGVGPQTAAKIVADREANGAFSKLEDLMRVTGIGEKKYEAIAPLVCI